MDWMWGGFLLGMLHPCVTRCSEGSKVLLARGAAPPLFTGVE